jgi:hypothetical protein
VKVAVQQLATVTINGRRYRPASPIDVPPGAELELSIIFSDDNVPRAVEMGRRGVLLIEMTGDVSGAAEELLSLHGHDQRAAAAVASCGHASSAVVASRFRHGSWSWRAVRALLYAFPRMGLLALLLLAVAGGCGTEGHRPCDYDRTLPCDNAEDGGTPHADLRPAAPAPAGPTCLDQDGAVLWCDVCRSSHTIDECVACGACFACTTDHCPPACTPSSACCPHGVSICDGGAS